MTKCENDYLCKSEPANVVNFRQIATGLADMYAAKNEDYGDSFSISVKKYGWIAGLTRISDKFNRFENLVLKNQVSTGGNVKDERITDTLLDMAAYCIMMSMEVGNA